jgi:hypothetical protein
MILPGGSAFSRRYVTGFASSGTRRNPNVVRFGRFIQDRHVMNPVNFIGVGAAGFSATFFDHSHILELDPCDAQHIEDSTGTLDSYGAEIISTYSFT